ncbi:MAG: hypothetical protein ACFB50_04550 [Rubrobacteraceae bacterium]
MSKKSNLLRDIDFIDEQISGLQGYLYEAELYPEQVQPWPRIKRFIYLFLLRKQVERQIQQLHLRRRAFRNCYVYLYKEEPDSGFGGEQREPAGIA